MKEKALLDVENETSSIKKQFASQLQLKINKMNCLILWVNNTISLIKGCVRTTITNKNKSFERELNLMIVEKITDLIPHRILTVQVNEISDCIPLAIFNVPGKVYILIGAGIFYEL